jgi:hypothetical protein
MNEKGPSSIRLAIRACIIRCNQSDTPLACLTDFTAELRLLEWDPASLQQIERGTLALLASIKKPLLWIED